MNYLPPFFLFMFFSAGCNILLNYFYHFLINIFPGSHFSIVIGFLIDVNMILLTYGLRFLFYIFMLFYNSNKLIDTYELVIEEKFLDNNNEIKIESKKTFFILLVVVNIIISFIVLYIGFTYFTYEYYFSKILAIYYSAVIFSTIILIPFYETPMLIESSKNMNFILSCVGLSTFMMLAFIVTDFFVGVQ